MSSLLLHTEVQLSTLAVCARPQEVIEVNDNVDSHSNVRKGPSDWKEHSSNDNPENSLGGKALWCLNVV